jgi:asparagine synthase (glutamine-hydrolysing)
MCGISGVYMRSEGAIDPDLVRRMNGALRHRGPDDEGYYADPGGRAMLGHRRLSVIDLATGRQPIFNESGTVAVVFNGEIYNFVELRDELIAKGYRFRTNTDTEVIAHLYDEVGVECVHRLRGMFAIAIWDETRRELILMRDRLGKKPIYYAEARGGFYFASEIQALAAVPGLCREVDECAIDLYLTYSYIPSPWSIYRAIRKLPPAHLLRVREGTLRLERYWQPSFEPKLDLDYGEAERELLRLFTESVRLRLISDVPLGVFLSGGVDSSAVAAVMSTISSGPIKTFSIGFSDPRYNELAYARVVAGHYRTDHHEWMVEPQALDVLPEIVRTYGEPYGDSSAIPTWYLSRLTRSHVTVALNGDGGDELFGGYPWHRVIPALNRAASFASPALMRRLARSRILPRRGRMLAELLSMTEAQRVLRLRSFLTDAERDRLYHREFRERVDRSADRYLEQVYDSGSLDRYDRVFRMDLLSYLPDDLLVKVDRASMAHGLECRSPLLDHHLLEFACRLPASWKIHRGRGKYIFKQAVRSLFPSGFLDRPKMGFSVPIGEWFKGEWKTWVSRALLDGPLPQRSILDRRELQAILTEHSSGRRNRETLIWNLAMLSLWFEQYAPA